MQFEPHIEPEREEEALLIVVDASVPHAAFETLRDTAFRLARTRVLYPIGKNDLIGVIQAGSGITSNLLADANPGGYSGIRVHVPLVTTSLRVLRALRGMSHDEKETNLLDLLDVAGDRLVTPAALRARAKRLLLFTDASSVMCDLSDEANEEFIGICALYRESKIRVDIILHGSIDVSEHAAQYSDLFVEDENGPEDAFQNLDSKEYVERAKGLSYAPLLALSKITGGVFMSLEDALPFVENPRPKHKRASVKFYGVLNIAGELQIPVKRYTHVLEVKPAPGKKLSWTETCKRGRTISAIAETNRVASAKDDTVLQPEQIINAYPYGPDLVPESANVDEYAWGMHLDRGLHVLGFVTQQSVPQHLFLSSVDVVIPIRDSPEAAKLMRTLVLALHAENLGVLARSVIPKSGGAPSLCYLWPRIELCRTTHAVRNCYLFAVDVPMREDVRNMGFGSLQDVLKDISHDVVDKMYSLISHSMLKINNDVGDTQSIENDDDDTDDENGTMSLRPFEIPNPNLNYMQICVAHRILCGTDSADLPDLSDWHTKLMCPDSFLRKDDIEGRNKAIDGLKSALPVLAVKQKEKQNRRAHTTMNGDTALMDHYLPADTMVPDGNVEPDDNDEDVDDLTGEEDAGDGEGSVFHSVPPAEHSIINAGVDGAMSELTDLNIVDVGDKTPVEDFLILVRHGKIGFGSQSMQVVVRRLIREGDNDEKVITCLQTLRKACKEHKEPRLFNDFIRSLVERCGGADVIGKRTVHVFRSMGRTGTFRTAAELIGPPPPAGVEHDSEEWKRYQGYLRYLQRCNREAEEFMKGEATEPSMSTVRD